MAAAGNRVAACVFGSLELVAELGCRRQDSGNCVLFFASEKVLRVKYSARVYMLFLPKGWEKKICWGKNENRIPWDVNTTIAIWWLSCNGRSSIQKLSIICYVCRENCVRLNNTKMYFAMRSLL